MQLFSNVIKSLMRDASKVASEASPEEGVEELRERLHLLAHYVSYTLMYCEECPWIPAEKTNRTLRAIDSPFSAEGNSN